MIHKKIQIGCTVAAFCFFSFTAAFAQQKGTYSADKDPIRDNDIVVPEMINSEVDLSLISWFGQKLENTPDCSKIQFGKMPVTDQDYINRLAKLPTVMEMPYNQIVRSFIDLYSQKRREQVSSMLGLANFYFPLFEEELAKNHMPIELKYLPVIESALNPTALSRAGASGLWQFMYSTGKIYDLNVDSFVDERRDPIKSTKAAVAYLKDLHSIYGDWHLAIAAYNCGPGNVNKAIRRANDKRDFWEIYNFLPRETRGYVPAFIAATYIMNYYNDHEICPRKTQLNMVTDTVQVNQMMHFEQISQILSISTDEIRALNPQYKMDIVPGNVSRQTLRLPMNAALAFHCNSDSICSYRANDFLVNTRRTVEVGNYASASGKSRVVTHKVRRGETLGKVAQRYGVTSAQVKKWNGLRKNTLKSGQRLRIYMPVPVESDVTENNNTQSNKSVAETVMASSSSSSSAATTPKQQQGTSVAEIALASQTEDNQSALMAEASTTTTTKETVKKAEPQKTKSTTTAKKAKAKTYKVKRGDTLTGISQRTGVSVDKIKRENNIRNSSQIKVGQVLKIPQG